MKRSAQIRLFLLGGLSAGAFVAGAPEAQAQPRLTAASHFTNDTFIPGAGYYHAPFHGFFAQRYNFYDPQRKLYYYGGQWHPQPHRSVVNISAPTPEAIKVAEKLRTDVPRSGFGSTSRSHHTWS